MSLRDQLVAKGLASKKDRRRVDRELKQKRKKKQGSRKRARQVEREREAQRKAELDERMARRGAVRRAAAAARGVHERRNRVFQIIRTNEIRSRGPIRFHHRTLDGRWLRCLQISERVAVKLRAGEAAIVAFDHGKRVEYSVISGRAAQELAEIESSWVVFHVQAPGPIEPSEGFWQPEWDISLAPHRARPDEVGRLRRVAIDG